MDETKLRFYIQPFQILNLTGKSEVTEDELGQVNEWLKKLEPIFTGFEGIDENSPEGRALLYDEYGDEYTKFLEYFKGNGNGNNIRSLFGKWYEEPGIYTHLINQLKKQPFENISGLFNGLEAEDFAFVNKSFEYVTKNLSFFVQLAKSQSHEVREAIARSKLAPGQALTYLAQHLKEDDEYTSQLLSMNENTPAYALYLITENKLQSLREQEENGVENIQLESTKLRMLLENENIPITSIMDIVDFARDNGLNGLELKARQVVQERVQDRLEDKDYYEDWEVFAAGREAAKEQRDRIAYAKGLVERGNKYLDAGKQDDLMRMAMNAVFDEGTYGHIEQIEDVVEILGQRDKGETLKIDNFSGETKDEMLIYLLDSREYEFTFSPQEIASDKESQAASAEFEKQCRDEIEGREDHPEI